jgi:hypothetical protein
MNVDDEIEVVNASARALMDRLAAGGKPDDENYYIGALANTVETDGAATDRVVGDLLITTASLIDDYVHEHGLCTYCNH